MKKNQDGFTIIELLVAIVLLGLSVVGITNLYINIEITQRKTQRLELATREGEKQIESLRNSEYNNLVPGSVVTFTNDLPDELTAPRSGTISVTEPADGIRRLDLTITYDEQGTTKTIKQSSLIGRIGVGQ